jgi:hypothetical protein
LLDGLHPIVRAAERRYTYNSCSVGSSSIRYLSE